MHRTESSRAEYCLSVSASEAAAFDLVLRSGRREPGEFVADACDRRTAGSPDSLPIGAAQAARGVAEICRLLLRLRRPDRQAIGAARGYCNGSSADLEARIQPSHIIDPLPLVPQAHR